MMLRYMELIISQTLFTPIEKNKNRLKCGKCEKYNGNLEDNKLND